ncbi:hypothetical protein ACFL29_00385 [Patescibacteria group bacterium]
MLIFDPDDYVWNFESIKWFKNFEQRRIDPKVVYDFLEREFKYDDDLGELGLCSISTEGDVLILSTDCVARLFFTREHASKFLNLIKAEILKGRQEIDELLAKIEELEKG